MGVAKLKKHWRYVIACYGAYPVFWVLGGGEVFDPSEQVAQKLGLKDTKNLGGWTDVGRYLRATDPTHHPVTVHEVSPDDLPLQDESVTDFHLFQPAHFSWPCIAVEIALLNTHYACTAVTKPLVIWEIGYERLGEQHLEDFQRVAFWSGMLNGAAGFTYGANGTWESNTADKPFQRMKWSLLTWEEEMNLPGSYQDGMNSKLLRQYEWWRFAPHPEWVTPRSTTMLEPPDGLNQFLVDLAGEWGDWTGSGVALAESEWKKRNGNFRLPYAAGIPGEVRFIYIPYFALLPADAPTIMGLDADVPYHAFFWDTSLGAKIDLGTVQRPSSGETIREDKFEDDATSAWTDYGAKSTRGGGRLSANRETVAVSLPTPQPSICRQ